MTKPRTLILAISTTAIAFAVALGSVAFGAAFDPTSGAGTAARQHKVALAVAPLEHATPDR